MRLNQSKAINAAKFVHLFVDLSHLQISGYINQGPSTLWHINLLFLC